MFNLERPLFKKPGWLKPEINVPKYYVHIIVLVLVALYIMRMIFMHDMLNFQLVWQTSLAVIAGDIVAHSVLKLD